MAYLCLECYEIYNMHLPYCPKTSCNCGTIIEVDELMLPTIILLNQKGYYTEFCCSGHIYDNVCHPYIALNSVINEILNETELKELFKELPEPWHIEDNDNFNRIILRCKVDIKDMVEMQKEICNANMKLLDFVNELPSLFDAE